MVAIRENRPGTEPVRGGRAGSLLLALAAALPGVASADANHATDFAQVYQLLESHCGACHVQGEADGPWSLNTPPSANRFPQCLTEAEAAALRCATYHELVDPPGPGIPAWIRPEDPQGSEPYAQACDTEISFHIGHSLPQKLPDADCVRFLRWIEAGAAP